MSRTVCCMLLILTITFAGCGRSADPSGGPASGVPPSESRGVIGFSALTLANPFFKVIADNMQAALKEHGYDMILVSGERDVKKQADQVDDFIVKGVSAIVLNPCDSQSIGPAIKRANEVEAVILIPSELYYKVDAENDPALKC